MKSKRSEYTHVATDNHLKVSLNTYNGGSCTIITLSEKELKEFVKVSINRIKEFKSNKDKGYFVHMSPEISLFIKSKK